MIDLVLEFLREHATTIRSLITLTLVSSICAVVGCFVILRRMAFLADALAHSMLAGVVVGYLTMKLLAGIEASSMGMFVGAVIAGLVTVALIGFVTRVSRIKQDTAIGIMYTGIFALGGFLATYKPLAEHVHVDLYHFIVGSVLSVTDADLWSLTLVVVGVGGAIAIFYRQLQLIAFDPVMAAALGVPVVIFDSLLTGCASLVVVWGVGIVGVVLVVALVVTPAATAYLLHDRLHRMIGTAIGLAITASWGGYALALYTETAPGPAIVLAGTAQFLLVLTVAPRYGLAADAWRKRAQLPQPLLEDLLLQFRRAGSERPSTAELVGSLPGHRVRAALPILERRGWIAPDGDGWQLTAEGEAEAGRLVRVHRLWETYLDQVGTPADALHETAHRLEHVHDESVVDYLADKLGHPLQDPHGSEIPLDPQRHAVGATIPVSELHPGFAVRVVRWDGDQASPVPVDLAVTSHPREASGSRWVLQGPGGERFVLDHAAADHLLVEIVRDRRGDTGTS